MDWPETIKTVCAERGWSIRHLAGDIGVSQTYLQDVVNGKKPPSSLLKVKLAGRLGWNKTSELLFELLPDDAAQAWKAWDDKTTKQLGESAERKLSKKEQKSKLSTKKTDSE